MTYSNLRAKWRGGVASKNSSGEFEGLAPHNLYADRKENKNNMTNKKLREIIEYFHCDGEVTIITKDKIMLVPIHEIAPEILEKEVRSSQSDCGHLTVWMEVD